MYGVGGYWAILEKSTCQIFEPLVLYSKTRRESRVSLLKSSSIFMNEISRQVKSWEVQTNSSQCCPRVESEWCLFHLGLNPDDELTLYVTAHIDMNYIHLAHNSILKKLKYLKLVWVGLLVLGGLSWSHSLTHI